MTVGKVLVQHIIIQFIVKLFQPYQGFGGIDLYGTVKDLVYVKKRIFAKK